MGPDDGDAALVAALKAGDEAAFRERRRALRRADAPARAELRPRPGGRGRGRAGGLAGRAARDRPLRGTVVVHDLDLPDRREHREDASRARGRSVPFSSCRRRRAVGRPDRFVAERRLGDPPASWALQPEARLVSAETREVIASAIDALPPAQRIVISLRDVEGWPSEEVRNVLDISESNQRVLLHRARSKVRAALEEYLKSMSTEEATRLACHRARRARDRLPRGLALAARACALRGAPRRLPRTAPPTSSSSARRSGSPGRCARTTSTRPRARRCSSSSGTGSASERVTHSPPRRGQ